MLVLMTIAFRLGLSSQSLASDNMRNKQRRHSVKKHRIEYSESDVENDIGGVDHGASTGASDNDENSTDVHERIPLASVSVGNINNKRCRRSVKKRSHMTHLRNSESDVENDVGGVDHDASNGASGNDETNHRICHPSVKKRRHILQPAIVGSATKHTVPPLRDDHSAKNKRSSSVCRDNDYSSKRRRAGTRIKWSDGELQALRISFKKFFELRKPPNNNSVEKAMLRFPCLKERSLPQIKSRAWHLIQTGR